MKRFAAALFTLFCLLSSLFGSDDHVRLDKPAVTVNIDWQNNMNNGFIRAIDLERALGKRK